VKPRVPLFVVALLMGASTWTMHRSTSADAQPERASQPPVPVAPRVSQESQAKPKARPAAYSAASLELFAARSPNR
jgi:hypothetical protein